MNKHDEILNALGVLGANRLDYNPVLLGIQALNGERDDVRSTEFAKILEPFIWGKTPNKSAVATAYVVAQTACLNHCRGPLLDGNKATIRQRWYFAKNTEALGFKYFAQSFEQYLIKSADVVFCGSQADEIEARKIGAKRVESKRSKKKVLLELDDDAKYHIWPKGQWGRVYAQLQSSTFASLVRDGMLYSDLWVEDVSRKVVETASPLADDVYLILAVEKEGLLNQFKPFCERAGIPVLLAMSGNSSFASIEAILARYFTDWHGDYEPTADNPLHVMVISDKDYYGEVPVQQGVLEQFGHYLGSDAIQLHRIGITTKQVEEITGRPAIESAYEFKHDRNKATREWAAEQAIWQDDKAYALEVEVLRAADFIPYIVDAVIEACGGDDALREKLLEMADADWDTVRRDIADKLAAATELAEKARLLAETSAEINRRVDAMMIDAASQLVGTEDEPQSWMHSDQAKDAIKAAMDDVAEGINAESFERHLSGGGWGAWRPSDSEAATRAATDEFAETHIDALLEATNRIDEEYARVTQDLEGAYNLICEHVEN